MKRMLHKTVLWLVMILLFASACTSAPALTPTPVNTPTPTPVPGVLTFTPTPVPGVLTFTPTLVPGVLTFTPTLVPGVLTFTPTPVPGIITDTPTLVPDFVTFTPTPVPGVITFTPTPVPPNVIALKNANCRYGPGTAYNIADTLFAGKTAPIFGRSEQNTWWQIKGPTFGSLCWVSNVTVSVNGSTDGVPIVKALPPPTLSPEPHKPQNQPQAQGCYVNDPFGKPVCTLPCPAGAVPGGACTP